MRTEEAWETVQACETARVGVDGDARCLALLNARVAWRLDPERALGVFFIRFVESFLFTVPSLSYHGPIAAEPGIASLSPDECI